MNAARQLGSYLRYIRMGMSRGGLASVCELPLETIYQIDQYEPNISADTLLHLARGLSFGLCDILRALDISTAFAKTYNTALVEETSAFRQENLREFIEIVTNDRHSLTDQDSPAHRALATVSEISNQASADPDHQSRLNPAELQRAYAQGIALGKHDLRDYLIHLILRTSQKSDNEGYRLFAQMVGISEASLHNLCGPLPVASFTDVLKIDTQLRLDGVLASIAWKVSEDQLGIFLDALEGNGRLASVSVKKWGETQRENAHVLTSLDYLYRKETPEYRTWYQDLLSAIQDNKQNNPAKTMV